MIGFLLLLIAVLLAIVLFPIGCLYSIITFRFNKRKLNSYAKTIALSIDQLGNVVLSTLFDDIFIKKDGYKFGDEDETISRVLGVNKKMGTLTRFGRLIALVLNKLDERHVEKASKDFKSD